jgi:hypothetical protein
MSVGSSWSLQEEPESKTLGSSEGGLIVPENCDASLLIAITSRSHPHHDFRI